MYLNKNYKHSDPYDTMIKVTDVQAKVTLLLESNYKIIFVDETVFSRSTIKKRAWRAPYQEFKVNDMRGEIKTLAAIGGISGRNGMEKLFVRPRSIDGITFLQFVRALVQESHGSPLALFLDNARIHYFKRAQKYCQTQGVPLVFNVAYMPSLNPIEHYWSMLKARFKSMMLKATQTLARPDTQAILEESIMAMDDEKVKRIAKDGEQILYLV